MAKRTTRKYDSDIEEQANEILDQVTAQEWSLLGRETIELIEKGTFEQNDLQAAAFCFLRNAIKQGYLTFITLELEDSDTVDLECLESPSKTKH